MTDRWRQLAYLSLAELGAFSLWFSASAVLPALTREWSLGDGGRAGLTLAVQLGFIVGTLVSAIGNLPDIWSPRRLMAASALVGALANAALALWVDTLTPALVLRFVTGAAMAGAYPPAMKIMATWFREGRGLAIGILVGALTVGSATPHLIRGATAVHWRVTLLVASGLALLAAVLVMAIVREGPHRFPSARFDARMALAVFRERGARLACFGYFGHMWELYAMWAWIGVFLAESFAHAGTPLNPATATFVVIGTGALGCYAAGAGADRWGRTTLTMAAMAVSGACAALIGLTFAAAPALTLAIAIVWGISVIADSAQFSTAITELSPPAYVGTALTTQTCVGFSITLISIWLIPLAVRAVGWRWAFAFLAIGPVLGVIAMGRLRALPEARRMAGGRR
ncbi:MAG: MFS transporter [Candidatus Rokubacteria bacterium]|nr:MFS transporter [Candidatus Rokubacteria bacterium]